MPNPSNLAEIQKITHFCGKLGCQGGGSHFYCRKIFLKVVFHEHNMSIIWNSPAPRLEIIYCRKAQWGTKRYYSPYNFWLESVRLEEQVSWEHSLEFWHACEKWCSPGGHVHKTRSFSLTMEHVPGPCAEMLSGAWPGQPWILPLSLE